MVFIYGDRLRSNIEAAIPTAGIQSSLFVLHEPAATSTENNSGALVSSSAFCFSKEKSSILSLSGDRRQLWFFLEQRPIQSLSISFMMLKIRCFRKFVFLHTAFAICLYVPRTSIFPKGSRSGCSSFWDVLLGHVTFTFTDVFNGFGSGCFTVD